MADSGVDAYVRNAERKRQRWSTVGWVAVLVVAVIVIVVTYLIQANMVPAGDDRVVQALHASGLRNEKLGSTDALACAEGESSRHFTATNPHGERVEGTVCCGLTGLAKGCTIRWGR